MGFKENFYANFPKAQKGTDYMDLKFLTAKERKVAKNVVFFFYKKIGSKDSRFAEYEHGICKAGRDINAKVMDADDVQTFITLSGTLQHAIATIPGTDKKKQFTDLVPVTEKIKKEAVAHYGKEFKIVKA